MVTASLPSELVIQTVDQGIFSPKLFTKEPTLTHAFGEAKGEMFLINNENFEAEYMIESTLNDWRLPPSLEDEDSMPGDKTSEIILEEAREAEGEAPLDLFIR